MADVQEDPPAGEDDNDSDRDDEDRLFVWMVNNDDGDEDEEEEEEVEEEQFETEGSETFELDAPAERSGHVAVVDGNIMYVWGGYKVCPAVQFSLYLQPFKSSKTVVCLLSLQECPDPWVL